jgi:predicted ATPase/signal transduction histidine kinase
MVMSMPGYRVTEQLHEGQGSNVYRGVRDSDGLAVVLKELKPAYPPPEKIAWFKREYELLRALDTTAVVKAHELGSSQYRWVMVLEDFGGESLDRIMRRRRLSLEEVLTLGVELVNALGQVHQRGLIHKSINPGNIVWNPERNELKLIDFEIATELPRQSAPPRNPDVIEGVLAYISPEQTGRMNRAIDFRSDFYSLGVTLYELLTGQLPFQSTEPLELVHCHIARQPTPPHQLGPAIPRPVSELVMKLMAKTAESRYQSAYGIKADLQECLNQLRARRTVEDFPLGRQDTLERFQLPQKLYGREKELERLLAGFDRVAAAPGRAELMLVTGHPGIGKSMLVRELYKPLTARRGCFISGKFEQLQRSTPYSAVAGAFRSLVKQLLGESEAQVTRWRERLLAALGPNGHVLIEIIPEVELIIGEQPPVAQLGPTEAQNRFNLVFQSAMRVFAQPQHPIVLFLDDLQWADSASLKLIELVMRDDELRHLFLIGAYRDNEVGPAHPLTMLLDSLRKGGTVLEELHLGPLNLEQTAELIADTLGQTSEAVRPLAELVHRKTEGNPLFVNELLKRVHQDGLLTFDAQEGRWRWDIARSKEKGLTDNVVELMIGNLKRLAVPTQQALKLAACLGHTFNLRTLATIQEQSLAETAALLSPALQAGFILTASEPEVRTEERGGEPSLLVHHYKFVHDRVQQAAYALIGEEERKAVHLRIGRLMLANATEQERAEQHFELVGHWNFGRSLLTAEKDRLTLVQLNAEAASKARASMAYAAAREYLTVAMEPLTENSWEEHYERTLHLHREFGEIEHLSGNYKRSEQLLRLALERARTPIEKADIYKILVVQYTILGRYHEALNEARKGLALLGVDLPEGDVKAAMQAEFAEVQKNLAGRDISSLLHEPPISDPRARSATRLLANILSTSFFVDQTLYRLIVFKAMNLSLRYGLATESLDLFASYGFLIAAMTGQYRSGYDFGMLGLKLSERFNSLASKTKVAFVLTHYLTPWVEHFRAAIPLQNDGYQAGLESGELRSTGFILVSKMFYQLFEGKRLSQVRADLRQFLLFNEKVQNQMTVDVLLGVKLIVSNLDGTTNGRLEFSADDLTEEKFLSRCRANKSIISICNFYVFKAIVLCHYGEASAALEASSKAEEFIHTIVNSAAVAQFNFYTSLSLAAEYPNQSEEKQQKSWARLKANQQQMKQWSESCPANYAHMHALVAAEMARLSGKDTEAMGLYEQAIALANKNGFPHQEALANELAARFARARGQEQRARELMAAAYYGYRLWGAVHKVKDLAAKHPHLRTDTGEARPGAAPSSNGGPGASGALDLISIVKACQAISSEIVLDKLLSKLMGIVIENAGAQRGVLLLARDGRLTVHVDAGLEAGSTPEAQALPMTADSYPSIAHGIINYVARTKESVILNDALHEGDFTLDPYVTRSEPRSILGTPLITQGQLVGILYLENNLTTGAFTSERLEFLRLLSHQIAISIQNALLYDEMEKKVEKRTEELRTRNTDLQSALQHLRETQLQLVQAEKMASLGQLAAGIAHEIKNPLNFINNFAELNVELIREMFDEMKNNPSLSASDIESMLADVRTNGERILEHGKRADDIIRSMMQHASGASGERQLTDVNTLVEEYVELAQHGLKGQESQGGMVLERAYDGAAGKAELVPQDIGRVLVNLLNNAFYAVRERQLSTPRGQYTARVTIRTRRRNQHVEIHVEDNGIGIPANLKSRLFEPFFTTKPPGAGTGLGLSLSYEIVVQGHRGMLSAQSEQGQGATFIVSLPSATE